MPEMNRLWEGGVVGSIARKCRDLQTKHQKETQIREAQQRGRLVHRIGSAAFIIDQAEEDINGAEDTLEDDYEEPLVTPGPSDEDSDLEEIEPPRLLQTRFR